ncbi:RecQ family ATP-dependent DNA helicase [Tundrisphaera sp. TA3]|uniref:RecQ family ATP-dependent DNA helicase n=1 Tax=Tundrisphaera sp. TA3 TaxID=3435775 RepID=UPI003EBC5123
MTATIDEARATLGRVFGFAEFREGQEAVVSRLLDGRSVLAIFPTGAGKSLCYQLPALLLDGLTVVVSPLIALMKDQVDSLVARGVAAARLDSSLDATQAGQVHADLRSGRIRILFIAPERLASERFVATLAGRPIALLAVDEAHCISEWGHNFRPDYLRLARVARSLAVGRVLALTATATPEVARSIAEAFGIAPGDVVRTGFHRPNLELHATPCTSAERDDLLLRRLAARPPGPAIVYVTLQRTAEELARQLAEHGYDAHAYHAGLPDEARHAVQDRFMASTSMIVVATIAFGMGIDKADIRAVYHYNLPKGPENHAQEIGRAGRDGRHAFCELLACPEDVVTLENFAHGDTPTREAIGSLLADVLSRGDEFEVSIHALSGVHDIRPLVVETLLTYLELEGVAESTGPFYAEVKVEPTRPLEEILARFDERRAEFLRRVFGQARKGSRWLTLDVPAAATALGESPARLLKALAYLEEQGEVVLQAAGLRQGYRRAAEGPGLDVLVEAMWARFRQREAREAERVRRMLAFAHEPGCLTRRMLAYFGEDLAADCGHCGPCLGAVPRTPIPAPARPLGRAEGTLIEALQAQAHPALATPRQMARFLCGLSSPATSRAKLTRDKRFGALSDVPFARVLEFLAGAGHAV